MTSKTIAIKPVILMEITNYLLLLKWKVKSLTICNVNECIVWTADI